MEPGSTSERLFRDCVRLVYRHRLRSLLSVLVFSFLPLIMGWEKQTRTVTLILVFAMWLYTFANLFLSRRVNRPEFGRDNAVFWSWLFHIQLVVFAILLNALFLYLVARHVEGALSFLMLVTAGFSAGAVGAYHHLKWAGPLFIGTAVVPQIVYFMLQPTSYSLLLAVALVVFLVFMTIVNWELHENTTRTLVVGYENADAKELAEQRALTDTLTGLQNRRGFFETAQHLLASARRNARQISLLMLDVDHFKRINDEYGHAAGDRALTCVAATLRAMIRESDIVARLGGEEFAIILPETGVAGGREIAERLRSEIQRIVFSPDGTRHPLTASIGIAGYDEGCESLDNLLGRADEALYMAKHNGRNRIEVFRLVPD